MDYPNSEHEFNPKPHESEKLTFVDKFKDLLPGVEFEESTEMLEARTAVLAALTSDQDPDFMRSVWMEYADVCEQAVDSRTGADPQIRSQLQIAALIHRH